MTYSDCWRPLSLNVIAVLPRLPTLPEMSCYNNTPNLVVAWFLNSTVTRVMNCEIRVQSVQIRVEKTRPLNRRILVPWLRIAFDLLSCSIEAQRFVDYTIEYFQRQFRRIHQEFEIFKRVVLLLFNHATTRLDMLFTNDIISLCRSAFVSKVSVTSHAQRVMRKGIFIEM